MKVMIYQDGTELTRWEFVIPSIIAYTIDYKATINNYLEHIDTEPVPEEKFEVHKSSERVTRVSWIDGERGDATYNMTAAFIE